MTSPITLVDEDGLVPTAPLAKPARTPRRSPADLPFSFATAELIDSIVDARQDPEWLKADRLEALAAWNALPVESNQLYTPYVDLRAADLFEVQPYLDDAPAGLGDDLDGLSLPAGVYLETFSAWQDRDPAGFRTAMEGGASLPSDDKLAMLARGFWSHGRHLEVAAGTVVREPIVIRWRSAAPGRALVTRTIVTLGEGASASVVEEQLPNGADVDCSEGQVVPQGFFHGTTEVSLAAESRLSFASVQEFGARQIVFQHRYARIGEAASLHWAMAQVGGRLVRSRVDNRLEGDRSSVEQVEIVFGTEDQLFDLTSYTRHIGRDTTGNLLSKGALMDRARSYMKGLITIDRSAVGTDSYLGEFGMNLAKATRAVAIPSLEIDQPDCRRAMHSSSVGPIDQAQLFYLESRGISPDDARKFIVLGFLEPVVARVPLEATQERLRELLDEKWAAGRAADPSGATGAAA
ncbi:MAG: SufD family Fe-S cluster assembly protein [Chloroflexota bacterium]